MTSDVAAPPAPARFDLVDTARGLALVAMIVFHSAWDLSYFGLIETDVGAHEGWRWFARCIAGTFLTLSGVSLVLGHGNGVRWRGFLRRLAIITAAAAAVTVATRIVLPDVYVIFGILHHIALASVVAVPFLRFPAWALVPASALAFSLPWLIKPGIDSPWLVWLGIGTSAPNSVDYVPLFPWFGCVLAGMALGRILLTRGASLGGLRASSPVTRSLARAGRLSLPIYLIHQPVLIAIVAGLAFVSGPTQAPDGLAGFETSCRTACRESGADAALCARSCACTRDRAAQDEALATALRGPALPPGLEERLATIARACAASSR